jgi:hypothetical protein
VRLLLTLTYKEMAAKEQIPAAIILVLISFLNCSIKKKPISLSQVVIFKKPRKSPESACRP